MHESPHEMPPRQADDSVEIPVASLRREMSEKSLALLRAEAELLFRKLMNTGKISASESPYIDSADADILEAQHGQRLWQGRLFADAGHDAHAKREAQFTDITFFFDMGFRDPLDLHTLLENLKLFESSVEHTSDTGQPIEHSDPQFEEKVKAKIAEVEAALGGAFGV